MHSLVNTLQSLQQQPNQAAGAPSSSKAIAESIFKELRSFGLKDKDIVVVSSELLSRLTLDIQARTHSLEAQKTNS